MTIECGWCGAATVVAASDVPNACRRCGRDPVVPWTQRAMKAPVVPGPAEDHEPAGRPKLEPGEIRQRIRIARKELGVGATKAALAEKLGISERQLGRWLKTSG